MDIYHEVMNRTVRELFWARLGQYIFVRVQFETPPETSHDRALGASNKNKLHKESL